MFSSTPLLRSEFSECGCQRTSTNQDLTGLISVRHECQAFMNGTNT